MRVALFFISMLALPLPALAEPTDATRAAARELGTEGVEDFQQGNFAAAADKLERAFKVVRAPSIGLWSARALVKTGKWVEAAERYLEVTRLDARTGEVAVQEQAQKDAAKEREELLARVPALRLEIKGAAGSVELKIDGTVIPSALVGAKLPVNPGAHVVEARDGARVVSAKANAPEGKVVPVVLDFANATSAPAATAAAPEEAAAAQPATALQPAADPGVSSGRRIPATAWVALGLGVVGVGAGTATGFMAMGQKDEVSSFCSGERCSPEVRAQVDNYNNLRLISTVSFVLGGVGLAAGGVLIVTAPKQPAQTAIVPWLGFGSAGINGSF